MKNPAITLKQLQCLVAVDQTKHFRKAADICGMTQPALSQQIQNLELTLNVQLVERSRAHVSLTPLGREVLERAKKMLDLSQSISDLTASTKGNLVGTIRLGTSPTIGPYLLPMVVASLHRQHQDLNLYVRENPAHDLEYELGKGTHDVLITQLPISGRNYNVVQLFREPLFLAMAIDHPLANKNKVQLKDIAGLDVLPLAPNYSLYDQVKTLCDDNGATLRRDYEGTSLDALRQMSGMGMGVSFLPALYAASEIKARSEVVVKPIHGRSLHRAVGMVWRQTTTQTKSYEILADIIRDVAKKKLRVHPAEASQ